MRESLPYSPAGLERLAAALNANSAYLWIDPRHQHLSLRDSWSTNRDKNRGKEKNEE